MPTTLCNRKVQLVALSLFLSSFPVSFTQLQRKSVLDTDSESQRTDQTEGNISIIANMAFQNENELTSQSTGDILKSNISSDSDTLLNLASIFLKLMSFLINNFFPALGVVGLTGNVICILVLVRNGLDKPSNIFLLGLAVADILCLLGAVNIPHIVRQYPKNVPYGFFVWEYNYGESYVFFLFYVIIIAVNFFGTLVSATLCVVITLERVTAVYLPLHFTNIVTPTRAWLVCVGSFLFWLPYALYGGTQWFVFVYVHFPQYRNTSAGASLFITSEATLILDLYVANWLGKFIPLLLVAAGSGLIAIKVSITLRKRQQMTSATTKTPSSGSRTTTTLLAVCVVFIISKIPVIPTYMLDKKDPYQHFIADFLGLFTFLFDYVNSSCNFIIYVILNRKFRSGLREIMCGKCGRK